MSSFDIDLLSGVLIEAALGVGLITNRIAPDPFYPEVTTPPGAIKDFCLVQSGDGSLTQVYQPLAIPGALSFEIEFSFFGEGEVRLLLNNQSGYEFDVRFRDDGVYVNGLRLSGSTRYIDGTDWVLRFVSTGDGSLEIFGRLASETTMLRRYRLEGIGATSSGRADGFYIETTGTSTDPGRIYLYTWRGADEKISPTDLPVAVLSTDSEVLVGAIHRLSGIDSYSALVPKSDLLYRWTVVSRPPSSDALLYGHEGASATSPQNITYISRKPSTEGEGTDVWVIPATGDPGVRYPLELKIGSGGNTIEVYPERTVAAVAPYDVTYLTTEDALVSAIMDPNHSSYNAEVSAKIKAIGGSTNIVAFYLVTLVNGYDSREQSTFFIPDVPGIYTFQLVVSDGTDESNPVRATVTAQPVLSALGETPDASYFWRHLPDDFYSRIENREWIETFWSTMIQVVGADLLELWQVDANRNLSTIQPSFQKRWLGYRAWFPLSSPGNIVPRDSSGTGWLTTTGDSSGDPFGKLLTKTFYTASQEDILAGDVLVNEDDGTVHEVIGYKHPVVTVSGSGIACGEVVASGQAGSVSPYDPKKFVITSGRATGAASGDYLWLRGKGYRIVSVSVYELTMLSDLPEVLDIGWEIARPKTSFSWSVPAYFTSDQEVDDGDTLELVRLGTLSTAVCRGSTGEKIAIEPGDYTAQDEPRRVRRRTRVPYPEGLLHIPTLKGNVEYKSGVDYSLGDEHIEFYTAHDFPEYLFAEVSYFNNDSAVEDNFGRVVGLTVSDLAELGVHERYLAAIRGLVFAFVKGPTLANIESAIGMLVGLPFTEEDGVILEIDPNYEAGRGRILIEGASGVIRSYFYKGEIATNPSTGVPYAPGDTVRRFRKITTGVELLDYQNSPGWFGLLVRAGVISDPEQIFTFEVRLDASVISDPTSLESAVRIARDLKPAYTDLRFALYTSVYDEIDVEDETTFAIRMLIEDNPHTTPYDIGRPYGYSYNLDHTDGEGNCPFQLDMDPRDYPEPGDGWGGEDIMMLDRILDVGPRDAIDIERVFDFRKEGPGVFGVLDSSGLPRVDAGFTLDQLNDLGLPDFIHGFFWYVDVPPTTEYLQDPETGLWSPVFSNAIHGLYRVFPRVDPRLDDPYLALTTPLVTEVQDINLAASVMGYFALPSDGTALYYWLVVNPTDTEVLIYFDGVLAGSVPALGGAWKYPVAIPRNVSVGLMALNNCTLSVKLMYPTPRFMNEPWPAVTSVSYEDLGATYRIHIYGYLFNIDWGGPDVDTFATVRVGSLAPTIGYVSRGPSYISVDFSSGDHAPGTYDVVVTNPMGKSGVLKDAVTIP